MRARRRDTATHAGICHHHNQRTSLPSQKPTTPAVTDTGDRQNKQQSTAQPFFNSQQALFTRRASAPIDSVSTGSIDRGPDTGQRTDHGVASRGTYSVDGRGNNPIYPNAGAAGSPLSRLTPADPSRAPGAAGNAELPNPRQISNVVLAAQRPKADPAGSSDLFWQWGQFIDHDMTLVPTADDTMGHVDAQAPIDVPRGDPALDPKGTGKQEIPFTHSATEKDARDDEQQTNKLTAFLDGSQVYGSDAETASALRSYEGGRMKTSAGNLLPVNGDTGEFMAGDERVNEQPGLTSMQTLFVREHNRLAGEYAATNPSWSDEQVYQAARSKNIAQMQAITYNEFLPKLLGENTLKPYEGYDPTVDPSISNEFATASFRFGHSMVTGDVQRRDGSGQALDDIPLSRAFDNPDIVKQFGIDSILRGQAANVGQALDNEIDDNLRNLLFGPPGTPGGGLDLAALNIQRGRDHQLGSYNDVRESLGMRRIESWHDPIFRDGVGAKLSQVYQHPDQIDLWVGGLAEKAAGSGKTGPTFTRINTNQFERLRDGDRNFYKNQYSGHELAQLESTTLSDIIKRNTTVDEIQDDAFTAPGAYS
jgi:hypothetical protein